MEHDASILFKLRVGNFDIYRFSDDTPLRAYVTEFQTSLPTNTENSNAKSSSDSSKKNTFTFDELLELAFLMRNAEQKSTKKGNTYPWTSMVEEVDHYYY